MIASMSGITGLPDRPYTTKDKEIDWWRTFALALIEKQNEPIDGPIIGKPKRSRKRIKRARKQATKSKRRG